MKMTIGETLIDSKALEAFTVGLPEQIPGLPTLMMRWAKEKTGFAKVSTDSVLRCIALAETMGLRVGGILDHCVIEPCGDKALLIPTVRGILYFAGINPPTFGVVRERDQFMPGSPMKHSYKLMERGSIVAVFCDSEVMTAHQVREIQNMSLAKDSDTWQKHWTETALRVCLRRRLKLTYLPPKDVTALEAFDREEFGDLRNRTIPPMPAVPPAETQQQTQSEPMFPTTTDERGFPVHDDFPAPQNNEDFSQHDDQAVTAAPVTGPAPPPKGYVQPTRDDGKKITGILWGKVFQVYESMHNGQRAESKDAMNAVGNTIGAAVKKLLVNRDFGSTFKTNELLPMLTQEEVNYLAAKLCEVEKVKAILQHHIDKIAAKSAPAPSF